MVVLNGSRCTCIDVISFNQVPQFLHDAGEILTGFVTFAKGEKMIFPIPFLLHRMKHHYAKEIENEHTKFAIKIREMEIFNCFEMRIATMELPGIINDQLEIDVPGLLQVFSTFNAIPENREKGILNACSKKSD